MNAVDGKTFEVINPTDESVTCSVQEATEKDVDIAVAAARKAFEGPWRKETPENRGKLLNKLAELFEKNVDLLASVEALDNGKAVSMAKVDVSMCAGTLRYYGGWADKIEGKVVDTTPDTFNYIKKEPIGVCAQIIVSVQRLALHSPTTNKLSAVELPTSHVVLEDCPSHCRW